MSIKRWSLILVLLSCAMVLSGCRTRGGGGEITDGLEPVDVLDGDYALIGNWGEDEMGNPVMDVVFENVLFGYDSTRISSGERSKVEAVAEYMEQNPGTRALLLGNCDERGSREYNMALGERRALAARAYLIGLEIDGSRLMPKSYGEEQPLDSGHNERAWAANRRVEFLLYN